MELVEIREEMDVWFESFGIGPAIISGCDNASVG